MAATATKRRTTTKKAVTSAAHSPTPADLTNDDRRLLSAVSERFASVVGVGRALFTTDASGLWDVFLAAIPKELRQIYSCNACRKFVDRFGGLVAITPEGETVPAMWGDVPGVFAKAINKLSVTVARAKVTGVVVAKEATWGTPVTGAWNHFAVTPPASMLHTSRTLTPGQVMAERHEDYGTLRRALAEYPVEIVRNALNLLTTGHLYRSEKCISVAKWLLDLHERIAATKNRKMSDNLVWLAVATAPPGFCHVRASVIGTLLDDLVSGLPFADIKAKFDAKMHPLQYQRPTSESSAANIAQAEKIVAQLGIAPALARRFATVEEVDAIWRPVVREQEVPASGGVFSHLKNREAARGDVEAPPITITWDKFARTVLPEAEIIEYRAEAGSYIGIVTAADADAPPLIQWDREDRRNPFSWYVYNQGSQPRDWNLLAREFVRVTAITLLPPSWYGATISHHGDGVILILQGARDLRYRVGAGFFPEQLRSEFHAVRKTLEAHALQAVVSGAETATACGLDLRKGGGSWNAVVMVTSRTGRASYRLDRWD